MKGGRKILSNKNISKNVIIFIVLLICNFIFFGNNISAQNINTDIENMDFVFVLDTSYSMNETDKDKISMEMIKLFTDISYSKRTRIGFVAYNDIIEGETPLTEISSDKDKETFKRNLDTIGRAGRTDIGLGLKKGWEILNKDNSGRKSCLVLLTDGEIDIDPTRNQRTVTDSRNDINYVIEQAAAQGVPIYTVAMGRNGVDIALLEDIANKTGASSYVANIPQELLEIFNSIFTLTSKSRFVPIAAVTATGDTQEISIKLPYHHVAEGNIIFLSSSALKETQVFSGSRNISFFNTQYYSTVKIVQPEQQDVKIRFKSSPNDVIKVNMLLYYDLTGEAQIEIQPRSAQSILLKANLIDSNLGQPIVDKKFYSTFTAAAIIKNLDTQEEVKVPMQATDNGWEVKHAFPSKGKYSYSVQADNKFYNVMIKSVEVNVDAAVDWDKVAIVLLILVMLVLIYYREKRPKPRFTGKMNAYYLKLKQGEDDEVPPLTILLQNINNQKKLSLFDMLHTLNADQGLTEGEKVWFAPGVDKTMILSHKSACTVVVGQNLVCKNQNYVLHYGDKIYVTFPDNIAEIELHYKSVKSAETCN